MPRLIPFPEFDWPGLARVPAEFFARARPAAAALALLALIAPGGGARADADNNDTRVREPIYRPMRPVDLGDFLTRCREDALYCEEQFTLYIQRYASVRIEELAKRAEYRKMRESLRDPNAFDGVCLPRERLLSETFPSELARGFRRWGEEHKEAHKMRPPPGIKLAMQTLYPCTQLN